MTGFPPENGFMSTPTAPSTTWQQQVGTVLGDGNWWHQQTWVAATEVIMGFLAVLGMARGLGVAEVAGGLAMANAAQALGVRPLAHGSRRAAVAWMLVAWGCIALALMATHESLAHWAGLCLAGGTLLAFRDAQTVRSMTWLPLRAQRRRTAVFQVSQWALIIGTLYSGLWMGISGFLMVHFAQWPLFVVALTLALGVPQAIRNRPKAHQWRRRRRRPCPLRHENRQQLHWMYRLTFPMYATHFVGRRLVLPAAVVQMAHEMGWGDNILPLFGVLLGIISFSTMATNLWLAQHARAEQEAERQLRQGVLFTVLGWMWIALALLLGSAHGWGWLGLLAGWIFIDLAARMVGVGYMETLRFLVSEGRPTRARVHRHALSRFMRWRSIGGGVGLLTAALVYPVMPGSLPLLVSLWTLICWWVWWRRPMQPLPNASPSSGKVRTAS